MNSKFEEMKEDVMQRLDELIVVYDEFTRHVGSSHWRRCGSHFVELKKIRKAVEHFTEITDEELNIPWIKEELERQRIGEDEKDV
jgi:hypothetical protein